MHLCLHEDPKVDWEKLVEWGVNTWKGKNHLRSLVCRLRLGAVISNVWKQRSTINYQRSMCSEEREIAAI